MDFVVYFGELKEDYRNTDNPFAVLNMQEEMFVGSNIFALANKYFGAPYEFDWGSLVWECNLDVLKRFCKEGKIKIDNIDGMSSTKKYGIVFIETR